MGIHYRADDDNFDPNAKLSPEERKWVDDFMAELEDGVSYVPPQQQQIDDFLEETYRTLKKIRNQSLVVGFVFGVAFFGVLAWLKR